GKRVLEYVCKCFQTEPSIIVALNNGADRERFTPSCARQCPSRLARSGQSSTRGPRKHVEDEGVMAEGVGFEPTVSCPTPVFKTGALNRSATPPAMIASAISVRVA